MAVAVQASKGAGIPVLTWDSDVLPENKDLRLAYIGTHNYEIGVNIAKILEAIKPKGGTICIQSGGAAAANHNERMKGIRDTLAGKESAQSPGERMTGQNGWNLRRERGLFRPRTSTEVLLPAGLLTARSDLRASLGPVRISALR